MRVKINNKLLIIVKQHVIAYVQNDSFDISRCNFELVIETALSWTVLRLPIKFTIYWKEL